MTTIEDAQIPRNSLNLPETIWWDSGELYLLDQTQLPLVVVGERQDTIEQVFDSIKVLKVRGAPAIGVAGAYGLLIGVRDQRELPTDLFLKELEARADWLGQARPTAVNLKWSLRRMVQFAQQHITQQQKGQQQKATTSSELYELLVGEAIRIHDEDRDLCRRIGEHGAPLIQAGQGILTHCNAGSLATSEFGTATSPMYVAHSAGVPFRVYADETRPLLQGARLTSWELQRSGIDVTLLADNMAAQTMADGLVDLVLVGTDRVAANGDVANKIGTLGVAILAKHFGIPFYVALPYSTIDFDMPTGEGIPIEERGAEEITNFGARRTGPEAIQVRNPAFDVTPHELVTGLITERGMIGPPYAENLRRLYESPS